jgi:hypothetical protein
MVGLYGPSNARRLATQISPMLRGAGAAEAHAILAHLVRLSARGHMISEAPLSLFSPFSLSPRSTCPETDRHTSLPPAALHAASDQ